MFELEAGTMADILFVTHVRELRLGPQAEAEWRPRMEHDGGQRLMEGSSDSSEDLT